MSVLVIIRGGEEVIVENGIRALQVVIPTISIFALRSALECGSHLGSAETEPTYVASKMTSH